MNEQLIGQILLKFYNKLAFSSNKIQFKSKFESLTIELSDKSNELLKNHFSNAFILLANTNDISQVWLRLNQNHEPLFKKRVIMQKRKGKSQNIFVENASLLLFSNFKSENDSVEFELYKGNRRSLHLTKQCYSVNLNNDFNRFTKKYVV